VFGGSWPHFDESEELFLQRGFEMRFVGFIGIGLVLALASTSTLAFQEQGGGAPAVTTPAPNVAPESGKAPDGQGGDINFSTPKPNGESAGTEVRIPGLGKLGVLPKMDFGLELLYGANEGVKQPDPVEQPSSDDLTIRGTMKHNF
jgi:hypothetical protein